MAKLNSTVGRLEGLVTTMARRSSYCDPASRLAQRCFRTGASPISQNLRCRRIWGPWLSAQSALTNSRHQTSDAIRRALCEYVVSAPVSHQKQLGQNKTKAIESEQACSKINEADRYSAAHNGLVAG